jgi:hypothetical protein
LKGTIFAVEDSMGVSLEEQRQRPPSGADIDRLPEAIQDQYMLVQH